MFDVEKVREDFPILKRKIDGKPLVFLDSASTSQKPIQVINAIKEYYEMHNANPHRSLYKLCEEATELYENTRKKVAEFINAKHPEEIIFVRNTNEAMNLIAHSFALPKLHNPNEIILSVMEHHANIVPWQYVRDNNGASLKFIDIKKDGTLNLEQLNPNSNTKMVSLTNASNVLGTINPIKDIGKIAHENGSLFVVDGAQSVPHMPIDVQDIGCDFLAFSGHKMLAPMNIGVLYGRKELLEDMEPFMLGSDMIKEVTLEKATWNDVPWKFEAGTPNVEGAVGLSTAIDYLNDLGMDDVRKHEKEITAYALDKLSEIDGLKVYGPTAADMRGGVISFNLAGIHSHDLATILNDFGIAIRSGHHCCMPLMKRLGIPAAARASFYIYTTKYEIDALANALKRSKAVFSK
ncbi:MAG: cysteine desulfurase [Candidatus Aenigmarchaeota archaeon]|nr:cysteine desulfurase [Candidatus Aenigmarchaeota archaeon]